MQPGTSYSWLRSLHAMASSLSQDGLFYKLLRLFVHPPASHIHRLGFVNRDDHVAVKLPRRHVRAIVFAGARGVIGVTVIKAQHGAAFARGGFVGGGELQGVDAEAVILLASVEDVLHRHELLDNPLIASISPDQ